jgi:hypothetical protein
MTHIPTGVHPTFDALSAHADRSDREGSGTRVASHLSRCASCRQSVAEIRALGVAARAVPLRAAPAYLAARIASAAESGTDSSLVVADRPPARAASPRRHTSTALVSASLIALVVSLLALWPHRPSLEAAGPSPLTFAPARPVPGGRLVVRYRPAARLDSTATLILVGRFARAAGLNPQPMGGRASVLADSLAVMTRDADGSFVAALRLPADFLAVQLGVIDPVRDAFDVDGHVPWLVIAGDPTGHPSLAALLAANDVRTEWVGTDESSRPRQRVDATDSLKRYFPAHPAGWAYTRSYGMMRGRFDFLRFFQSAERKYASLFDELWPSANLDAERLHDMVVFAQNIGEPGESLRWARRLVQEHPDDPRAVADLAGALHGLELESFPAAADSIRQALPALDRAFLAARPPYADFGDAIRLAAAYGDSVTSARWLQRGAEAGLVDAWPSRVRPTPRLDEARRELRSSSQRPCTLPPARRPLGSSVEWWTRRCELFRGLSLARSSTELLEQGSARAALVAADSGVVALRRAGLCVLSRAERPRALAALATGDTIQAARDLAVSSVADPAAASAGRDTARHRLGARYDDVAFRRLADSATHARATCEAQFREGVRGRQRRIGG